MRRNRSQPVYPSNNSLRLPHRYLFKTATGDRLLNVLPDGRVRWPYRESGTGQWRTVDLQPFELIRRFLKHVRAKTQCPLRTSGLCTSPTKSPL